jgi:YidC/Oxa1 family membrane protein insertase
MAETPNKALRWGVILIAAVLAAGVFTAVLRNTGRQNSAILDAKSNPTQAANGGTPSVEAQDPKAQSATTPAGATPAPSTPNTSTPAPSTPASNPQANPAVPGAQAPALKLAARADAAGAADPAALGGLDPAGGDLVKLEFSLHGAGIKSATLARYFTEIDQKTNVEVQREQQMLSGRNLTPMALLGVQINGTYVDLLSPDVWKSGPAAGNFQAVIYDTETGKDVARVTRRYELPADSYSVRIHQNLVNLTDAPLTVRWFQLGPSEMPADKITYGGDKRRVRFGYLVDPKSDPSRQLVLGSDSAVVLDHATFMGPLDAMGRPAADMKLWPNETTAKRGYELVWTGSTNRYFAAIATPLVNLNPPAGTIRALAMPRIEMVDRIVRDGVNGSWLSALRLNDRGETIGAGGTLDASQALFVGPQSAQVIRRDPLATATGVDQVVLFNFGGMCGCCTFAWLTEPLLKLLIVLHDYVTRDWALAIMLLVVIVRTTLHPVTKWSQIRVQRFGKQMQSIAPKMQQIKEKFADDPKKQQEETARLWREEGINPAGMLGCLPMFLQTPIWIALSAMLFFAIEIRHQSAFFGVFQKMGSPDGSFPFWFLGDLAEPDRLIYFHKTLFTAPMMGEISSFNILPLLMGVLFYIQQKYMSPPPSATTTPEQELQMKMMKWMTVFLFPLMMYNAPSGLTLYFFTNSVLGIMESKWIKSHIDKHDLLNVDKMREERKAKGGGAMANWWSNLQERAALAKQKQEEAARKQAGGGKPKNGPQDRFRNKR